MFEKLAAQYYDQDVISDSLAAEVNKCMSRAKDVLQESIYNTIREKNSFHDWYLTVFEICSESHTLLCRLQFKKNELQYDLVLKKLIFASICGDIVSSTANYPPLLTGTSLAQVLALWIDHTDHYELCILLDNERYIILRAKEIMM